MKHYDVMIVGGGLVGASLAIPLSKLGLKVAVIEAAKAVVDHQPDAARAIVLSASSQTILQGIGLWSGVQSVAVPIEKIHVSERGRFGAVRMTAQQEKVDALGYVVLAHHLYDVLRDAMAPLDNIDVYYETKYQQMQRDKNVTQLTLLQQEKTLQLTADLVIAADGSRSTIREQQEFKTTTVDYHQYVIISNVQLNRSNQQVAYERFTHEGPLAMLPIGPQKSAAVWTVAPSKVEALIALPEQDFLAELQKTFGFRLGKFQSATKPVAFPLQLIKAQKLYKEGLVILGNAAHTLHPIAGQGLNLGLRDTAVLVQHLSDAVQKNVNLGNEDMLASYANDRMWDYRRTITVTHSLVGIFSNGFLPLALARNIGLVMMQRLPRLRSLLAKLSMGKLGKQSRLVANVPLDEWQKVYE